MKFSFFNWLSIDETPTICYTSLVMKIKRILKYFSIVEWLLWIISSTVIILSFLLSGDFYPLTLVASLVGVTALVFLAKGNVVGQFLIIAFSILYAIISIRFRYWGEMITYLFMSLPASVFACVSWLKHPSKKGKNEVEIAPMTMKKWLISLLLSLFATAIFGLSLYLLETPNLLFSIISITTSFLAASLLFLRSRYYALAYAANDVVLILLWTLASIQSISYLPMVVCFVAFLVNDSYGFFNWKRLQNRQKEE